MNGALLTFLIALPSYFVIGFIWASLVCYFGWSYPDMYANFWFSFWLWWIDLLRKFTNWLRDCGDYYARRLGEIRRDREKKQ